MARFNGKNDLESIKTLFYERIDYDANAYADRNGDGPLGVNDLNLAEMNYYGRVDQFMESVIPDPQFVSQLRYKYNPDIRVGALDFVADAFYDFNKLFFDAVASRRIPANSSFLSKVTANVGYVDPIEQYHEHLDLISNTFLDVYILENKLNSNITDFKSFVNAFINFLRLLTDHYPVTMTAWIRSIEASPFNSGIFLDLGTFDKDRDDMKEDTIIKDPAFQFYANACVKHGFMISHRNPSIICADLASPGLKPYLEKYDLVGVSDVFARRFRKTHTVDIDELRRMLFNMYNAFITKYPFYRISEFCSRTNKKITNIKFRNTLDIEDFNNINNNKYLIKLYIILRNIEENEVFGESDLVRMTRQANFFEKKVDISRAIRYINEQYRSTFKSKPGGINWYAKWFDERKKHRNM